MLVLIDSNDLLYIAFILPCAKNEDGTPCRFACNIHKVLPFDLLALVARMNTLAV